eukprot:TRINITY_DN35212_c0_g1_i1.p1 TRINITY_DN35212_c0_g1~~TRINITY_DN35212_c0_g1_i1.p1  ORF type:complete len:101 (+),score=19.71 TRINITY_DN35212_c0_g1_i1:38-304(+)
MDAPWMQNLAVVVEHYLALGQIGLQRMEHAIAAAGGHLPPAARQRLRLGPWGGWQPPENLQHILALATSWTSAWLSFVFIRTCMSLTL